MTVGIEKLRSRAIFLSWFTIVYNFIEGAFAILFGWSEGSISLMGFGMDSYIEVASALLVLWRFRGEIGRSHEISLQRERKATFGIGVLFLVLGFATIFGAGIQLYQGHHPETTLPGVIVSGVSLSFMFWLWGAKKTVGNQLSSSTVLKDADCSFACIKLSFILLIGSILFWIFPKLWWIDAVAAIGIACFILREGKEAIEAARREDFQGGGCGCSP